MGLMVEGSDQKTGIRKIEGPRFRAVCWYDGYRGPDQLSQGWAEDDLAEHANTTRHHEAVLNYLVRQENGVGRL